MGRSLWVGSWCLKVGHILKDQAGKGCKGTNTLAYFNRTPMTTKRGFITLTPGPNVIELFTGIIY
jgi:hypothetical protein